MPHPPSPTITSSSSSPTLQSPKGSGKARANTDSPYYPGLSDVLTRAFGVPAVLAETLRSVGEIDDAYIYGSWAARHAGEYGQRPVRDIDVLILGEPDHDQLFGALGSAEERLGRPVEASIRDSDWLASGTGQFHETLIGRPLLRIPIHPGLIEPPQRLRR